VTFDYKTCKLSISSLQYLDTNSGEAWQWYRVCYGCTWHLGDNTWSYDEICWK
jgi:hypothetical protein